MPGPDAERAVSRSILGGPYLGSGGMQIRRGSVPWIGLAPQCPTPTERWEQRSRSRQPQLAAASGRRRRAARCLRRLVTDSARHPATSGRRPVLRACATASQGSARQLQGTIPAPLVTPVSRSFPRASSTAPTNSEASPHGVPCDRCQPRLSERRHRADSAPPASRGSARL